MVRSLLRKFLHNNYVILIVYSILCDNVYCYVIAIVFIWEALNGTIALHLSMELDVGLTKPQHSNSNEAERAN